MSAPQASQPTRLSDPYFNRSNSRSSSVDRYPVGGSQRSYAPSDNGFLQDRDGGKISCPLLCLDG